MISKYVRILNRLVEKTDQGEIDWKETASESGFLVSFPNYSLVLNETYKRGQELPDYVISVINSDGRTVDKFSDVDLQHEDGGGKYYEIMKELYNQARRKALGVDEALDDILTELDEGS